MKKQITTLVGLLIICGCASKPLPLVRAVEPWTNASSSKGRIYRTAHYAIHTTLTDSAPVEEMAALLEHALPYYEALTGVAHRGDRPLPVYYFGTHDEWAAYTRATTGASADIYLGVFNGGYAIGDRVVCWHGNAGDVLSTVAHEGLHQFVARNFSRRLPPVIEEGLAVACEDVDPQALTPRDRLVPRRQNALRAAIAGQYLIPLDTFLKLHAGDLSDRPDALREGFYAQCWAVATFLRTSPKYRPSFLRLLTDSAAGTAAINVGPNRAEAPYNAGLIRPLLEKYLPVDWPTFRADLEAWLVPYDAHKVSEMNAPD
jgi:hypothetical protein